CNTNMHKVEGYLIVYDVTDDKKWLDSAIRLTSMIIHDFARNDHYRVNEHFETQWNPLPDYNQDNPSHRFRAFGGTPGPCIDWGRLILRHHADLDARCEQPPDWLLQNAKRLQHATVRDARAPHGADVLAYTADPYTHLTQWLINIV
ncbi:AGE family epimerase/isomerase, partial [Escherichia coli]|uniref:AGE family epimerase/isomerase n=1 Tax=Escherichia coli TaxID=562 RepID=UPI001939730E